MRRWQLPSGSVGRFGLHQSRAGIRRGSADSNSACSVATHDERMAFASLTGLARLGLLGLLMCVAGCNGTWPGGSADSELSEDEFAELADGETSTELGSATSTPTTDLALHLRVGDRFPLQKSIEQRLLQKVSRDVTAGHSRVDLLLAMTVEEVQQANVRFGVRYQRVSFAQEVAGERVEYNSANPTGSVPPEAELYASLVGNGFSFWVGADRKVREVIGYEAFAQQCLAAIDPSRRAAIEPQFAALNGPDGVANFVDDSLGLLPSTGTGPGALQVGSRWTLSPRQVDESIPTAIATNCLLKELTDKTAEINLYSNIPATIVEDATRGVRVTVSGGRCLGSCVVDLKTGLPVSSRVERSLDMLVELPDGSRIPQQKSTITTVSTFLDASAPRTAMSADLGSGAPLAGLNGPIQPGLNDAPAFGSSGSTAQTAGFTPQRESRIEQTQFAPSAQPAGSDWTR